MSIENIKQNTMSRKFKVSFERFAREGLVNDLIKILKRKGLDIVGNPGSKSDYLCWKNVN